MSIGAGAGDAGRMAQQAANSEWLERAARAGYVVNGVLHLLIAYIALQVAWSSSGKQADQSGALSLLAENSVGKSVLWLGVAGFLGLALWQLAEALFTRASARAGVEAKGKAAAKGVIYLVLSYTSFTFVRGSGSSSSKQSRDFTAELLKQPGGRILVVLVGLVILGVGLYHVHKGVTKTFLDDLAGHPGDTVVRLGQFGYVAKGVALAVVGLLFCVAGIKQNSGAATGLDGALKTLREQPFGTLLLTVVAIGLAAYGGYSFARARYAKL